MSEPPIDILIPSRNRPARLRRLLRSLEPERGGPGRVLVLANGLDPRMVRPYRALARSHPWIELIELGPPGKARALNAGIERSRAEWIAFLDDDVLVRPGWARAWRRAAASGGACFQGRIRFAPRVYADPGAMELYGTYRMLPQVDPPEDGAERRAMVGANCMVARQALIAAGGFDERLGPGASGLDEDTEISRRLRALGHRIRFVRDAAVEHDFRASRLTPRALDRYSASLGRGRAIMRPDRSRLSMLGQAAFWGLREGAAAVVLWNRQRLRCRCKRLIYLQILASLGQPSVQPRRSPTAPWPAPELPLVGSVGSSLPSSPRVMPKA